MTQIGERFCLEQSGVCRKMEAEMKSRLCKTFIGAIGLILFVAVEAQAAEGKQGQLVLVDGVAMMSEGARYVPVSEGRSIKLGDRLMLLEGGRAAIWYGDTCEYFLGDREVLDVTETSPCVAGLGGQFRPEIADMEASDSVEAVRLRLTQFGSDAPAADDTPTADGTPTAQSTPPAEGTPTTSSTPTPGIENVAATGTTGTATTTATSLVSGLSTTTLTLATVVAATTGVLIEEATQNNEDDPDISEIQ